MRTFKLLGRIGIVALGILTATIAPVFAQDAPTSLAVIQQKIDAGDFKSASNLSSIYLKSNQADAQAHYLLGQSLFKLGKFAQSKVELKEATKMASTQLHPVVPPHVSHFKHVPFRTMVKFPHSGQDSPT